MVPIGNRVVAARSPRVAAGDAFGGQPAAFYGAMLFQGFQGIGRAGGLIATIEPNPRRKDQPIGPDGQGGEMGERGH